MKQADVLKEIARIEGELAKLQKELGALRARVDGGHGRAMTMAFGAPQPRGEGAALAPTIPPPVPSRAPRTGTRSVPPSSLGAKATSMESLPPPAPTRRSRSTIAPAPREGSESTSRDGSSSEVGRYGIVSEGRTRTSNRTR
jgi:hypothetical protein